MYKYDHVHAEHYDVYSTGVNGDVKFYTEEAARVGSPVLELACGTGRILIPVAGNGIEITGLDVSPAMLDVARRKVENLAPEVRGRIELLEGDMREFSLDRKFELIMVPYRSFLHLLTSEDQKQALACIREHLADDGKLILNVFDPRLDLMAAHFGPLGPALKKQLEFTNPDTGNRMVMWHTIHYNLENQIITEDRFIDEIDSGGVVVRRTTTTLALRWVYRYEMQYLLESCGYRIEALYGDFKRGEFHYGGEQIWVVGKDGTK